MRSNRLAISLTQRLARKLSGFSESLEHARRYGNFKLTEYQERTIIIIVRSLEHRKLTAIWGAFCSIYSQS